jgi:hypothetical protein
MNFGKTILVGAKAIVGSIVSAFIFFLVMIIGAFIVGLAPMELWANRPSLGWLLFMVGLVLNIYVLGWVYNKLWGWK